MRLTEEQKIQYMDRLWNITHESYTGVQLPTREIFEKHVKHGDVFVHEGNPIAGYALVDLMLPLLLRSIAVLSAYRKFGIGGELLKEVSDYYRERGFNKITLHVHVDNPAQKLYFDSGYRVTKVLHRWYLSEGDGLEMEKKL